jgi:hypothetical protein
MAYTSFRVKVFAVEFVPISALIPGQKSHTASSKAVNWRHVKRWIFPTDGFIKIYSFQVMVIRERLFQQPGVFAPKSDRTRAKYLQNAPLTRWRQPGLLQTGLGCAFFSLGYVKFPLLWIKP